MLCVQKKRKKEKKIVNNVINWNNEIVINTLKENEIGLALIVPERKIVKVIYSYHVFIVGSSKEEKKKIIIIITIIKDRSNERCKITLKRKVMIKRKVNK